MRPAALCATSHLPIEILVAAAVACDQLSEDFTPAIAGVGVAHADLGKAARESVAVSPEAERAASINRHDLINPVRVQKAAVKGRDARLFQRRVRAVQVTDRKGVRHGPVTSVANETIAQRRPRRASTSRLPRQVRTARAVRARQPRLWHWSP